MRAHATVLTLTEPVFEDEFRRAFANLKALRGTEIGEPPFPNWAAVGVNWLAGFDFEIKVI